MCEYFAARHDMGTMPPHVSNFDGHYFISQAVIIYASFGRPLMLYAMLLSATRPAYGTPASMPAQSLARGRQMTGYRDAPLMLRLKCFRQLSSRFT